MLKWIADTLLLVTISFAGYVICLGVNRKTSAQMVLYVAAMLFLLNTIQDITPIIRGTYDKARSVKQKVDNVQQSIDKFNSTVEGAGKIFHLGEPNLPGQPK